MIFLLKELIQGDVSAVVERTTDGETDGAAEELQSLGEAEDEAPAAHSWIEQEGEGRGLLTASASS